MLGRSWKFAGNISGARSFAESGLLAMSHSNGVQCHMFQTMGMAY
jgi:hypothetical protein